MEDRVILTPKERLQRLSEHLDVSVRGLATLAEMSEATLYHITDGTRDMSGRTAARLCYQLERKRGVVVDRNWLLTGNGRMLVDIKPDKPAHHVYYIGSERHDEIVPKCQLITTHTARHTFIVTAISLGIPIPVIMEWTGHSGYNAMRPYIAIANATSRRAMNLFNTL